jgi:hypothetical protein
MLSVPSSTACSSLMLTAKSGNSPVMLRDPSRQPGLAGSRGYPRSRTAHGTAGRHALKAAHSFYPQAVLPAAPRQYGPWRPGRVAFPALCVADWRTVVMSAAVSVLVFTSLSGGAVRAGYEEGSCRDHRLRVSG